MGMDWLRANAEAVLIIILTGIVSGVAQFWIKIKTGKIRLGLHEFLGEMLITGSASWIAGMLMLPYAPLPVVFACSGIAGHMGTRFIAAMDKSATRMINHKTGNPEDG